MLILFAVVDVLGSTAIIINMSKKVGYIHAKKTATVVGVMVITFYKASKRRSYQFVGQTILDLFYIDEFLYPSC